uniref:C2 domain-containing protein n=1 Tax=Parascaris univalens TaxID=6257 RepID=A0A915AXF7_PARUN
SDNFYDDVAEKHHSKKEKKYGVNIFDDEMNGYHKEAPPIPVHRCVDGRASPSFDYYSSSNALADNLTMKAMGRRNHPNVYERYQPESLGYLNVALSYNRLSSTLFVTILSARGLSYRQYSNTAFYPNPFVKIYLLPGRKVSNKRRTKFMPNTADPVWNQTVEYMIP